MVLLAAAVIGAALTPPLASRLEGGEIVVDVRHGADGLPVGKSLGVVGAPVETVWSAMTDFDRYPQYYNGIPRCETRRRTGNTVHVYIALDFPWPLPDRWTLEEFTLDPEAHRFEWKRIDGTVRKYEGWASFSPWSGNRTLMRFEGTIDPGFSLLPGWLLTYFARVSLPAVILGPREYLARTAKAAL